MLICTIASITVTAAPIALWLKNGRVYIKQGSLPVQQKCVQLCITLTKPAAPSNSEMMLRYLSYYIISSLGCGQWWGIVRLCCCCLFSAIVYSLSLDLFGPVRAGTAPARGRGAAQYMQCEGGGHWVEPQTADL